MFDLSEAPAEEPSAIRRARAVWQREGLPGLLRRFARRFRRQRASFEDLWISLHCAEEPARHPMLDRRFLRAIGGYTPREDYLRPLREAPTDELLDRCLYHDQRSYLPMLLQMEDRASMAVSLESRVPLLDHRLVELMATVPPALKVWGREPKRLLREIAVSVIPESVRGRRDKSPFPVPLGPWFAGGLAGMVRGILHSPQCLDRGIFNPDRIREDGLSPATLWQLLNVELWFRIFIDRDRTWLERATLLQSRATDGIGVNRRGEPRHALAPPASTPA
jgi:asparagine synthase (glutamine-hydrolysing)